MRRRRWISSGIEEEIDARQQRLLDSVMGAVRHYYRELHGTQDRYQYPLSLKQLMKLTNRSAVTLINAVRVLSHSIEPGMDSPLLYYDRVKSERNRSHRPYRIYLRKCDPTSLRK